MEGIYITVAGGRVRIPLKELIIRTARSGGPGGQHVNKVETSVELLFDVRHSPRLTESDRVRILSGLATRIDSKGILHVGASAERSQYQNRQKAVRRFTDLLENALRVRKRRIGTRPTAGAKERRLRSKKIRSERKRERRSLGD